MPRKQLKKWLPKPEDLLKNRSVQMFAPHLADARLWHFNRDCLTKAVYIGVMCAFFPLPGQMLLALIACLIVRANVPMALGLTWITNPLTTIPIFYASYWVGAQILGEPMISLRLVGHMLSAFSLWLFASGDNPFVTFRDAFSWSAFCLGLLVLAVICSLICGMTFKLFWRYKIISMWRQRQGYRGENYQIKRQQISTLTIANNNNSTNNSAEKDTSSSSPAAGVDNAANISDDINISACVQMIPASTVPTVTPVAVSNPLNEPPSQLHSTVSSKLPTKLTN